jgi:hypothetical protein
MDGWLRLKEGGKEGGLICVTIMHEGFIQSVCKVCVYMNNGIVVEYRHLQRT